MQAVICKYPNENATYITDCVKEYLAELERNNLLAKG